MGGPGSGRRRKNNDAEEAREMMGLFFESPPKIEEHDAMMMWRKGFKNLRDDSRVNLEKRIGGLHRNKRKMIRRIENAFRQIQQMEVAERVYERELRRFRQRSDTYTDCFFLRDLDAQINAQKEKMR